MKSAFLTYWKAASAQRWNPPAITTMIKTCKQRFTIIVLLAKRLGRFPQYSSHFATAARISCNVTQPEDRRNTIFELVSYRTLTPYSPACAFPSHFTLWSELMYQVSRGDFRVKQVQGPGIHG